MYLIRILGAEGDWRLAGETSVSVRWGDETRRTCGRFNEPLVWEELLAFERPHLQESVCVTVVELTPLGESEVASQGWVPFEKGAFQVAGVRGEMLTAMDSTLGQLVRLTEENNRLSGKRRKRVKNSGSAH